MDQGVVAAMWQSYVTGLAKGAIGQGTPADPFGPELNKEMAQAMLTLTGRPGAQPVTDQAVSAQADSDAADPAV